MTSRARTIADFGDGIATADIDDGAITSGKLASGAITASALPAGSVLQVQSFSHTTRLNTNSTAFVATSTAVNITPSSTASEIWVSVSSNTDLNNTSGHTSVYTLYRDSTNLGDSSNGFGMVFGSGVRVRVPVDFQYLDSPATTSQITYTLYVRTNNGSSTVEWSGDNNVTHTITAVEIAG